ncbi:MAG: hypothetical protein A2170_08490 [Deltaproteobacteria bacterium RBG_13_53_10]|nr:MAG: hypothetical protein A2170_08490 [Deltaproteobacteria bacterium RBG_13_53_10]
MSYPPEKIVWGNIIHMWNKDNLTMNYSDIPELSPHYQFAIVIYTILEKLGKRKVEEEVFKSLKSCRARTG